MQKKYACVRYMHSRVTIYHPCKIDLRYSKALHSCATCRFLQLGLPCSAIHYGMCQGISFPLSPKSTSASSSSSSSPSPVTVQKSVSVHIPKPSHPPIPIPVVSVTRKPTSPVVVVVSNSSNGHARNARLVPQNSDISANFRPAHLGGQTSVQITGPVQGGPASVQITGPVQGGPASVQITGPVQGGPAHLGGQTSVQITGSVQGGPASVQITGPVQGGPAHLGGQTSVHITGPAQVGPAQSVAAVQTVGGTTQVIVRTSPAGSIGLPRGTVTRAVAGGRTPVKVVVTKPSSLSGSAGINFSFSAAEDEVYPAFPVSPEDKIQLSVPNGDQKNHHHGILQEKDPQAQDKEVGKGDNLSVNDSAIKDSKTPSTTTSSTSITLSRPSFSSSSTISIQQEEKKTKPKAGELPVPRKIVAVRSEDIPQFYYPFGKPGAASEVESLIQKASAEFAKLEGGKAYKQQMGQIAKACGFPMYWKILLFRAAGGEKQGYVTLQSFSAMLKKVFTSCHDEASRFVGLLAKPGRMVLEFDDVVPLVQDVVDCHPGLSFLQDAPEFHSRYVHTVVARIFFSINRSWTGRITVTELRKSNFLQTLAILEDEEDINQVTEFFSYEHFYVIYCKFWELDKDHDLFIDKSDLARHNEHALNSRIIDRIFSGAVTRGKDFQESRMSYKEFVWFLLSEEDKKHPTSIEYWFRCMDLDGDGVISMYEMEYFYEEQMQKMEALGIEKLPFEDCLCQMYDLVRPRIEEHITLSDLKNCQMANIFFDTFFNLDKFLEHEQRDPFANARDVDTVGNELSDWDRYAAEEYDILVAEEGMNDQDEIHYEDDFEPDDDELIEEEVARLAEPQQRKVTPRLHPATCEDIYDFSNSNLGY